MNLFSAIWPGHTPPTAYPPGPIPTLSFAGKLSGKPAGKSPGKRPVADRQASPHRAVADALRNAARPLSITELAAVMGCSVGESSKRVKAARSILHVRKVGRCKLVRLRSMDWPEYRALFEGRAA